MLKIKDNVDLKELEKFGFKYEFSDCLVSYDGEHLDYDLTINKTTREIYRDVYEPYDDGLQIHSFDLLSDLIKANLVEKVQE